jgi:hypothetical protein
MTQLPRAMTAPELAYIRDDGQSSELFLWCDVPPVVYSARINQTFTSLDSVIQITYDTGSGTLANVLPGMTMYIGTAAGLYDIGFARIRKTPSGTVFYIGEESEMVLADNLYLTVVDQFIIWPRHPALDSSNIEYMDDDIAYSDQHTNLNPVPCIGPRYIPVWLTGATIAVVFDASLSWILDGTTLSYVWTAPGASATSGLSTATPTIAYNAAGRYRVKCTVTSTNGKTTDAYAWVRVFTVANPPITQFDLKNCSGSWQRGGWQTQITLWAQADFSTIVERAACVLFARDFYGTTEISLSPVAGRENIVTEGWIDAESMVEDPDGASLDFTIEGPNAWLDKITGFAVGIQNQNAASDAWTNWSSLTVDESFYHLLFWQATAIPVIDVFPTGDTRISPEQSVPGEMTLWQQITYLLTNTILARAIADRYGRLFAEIDTDLLPTASRSSLPWPAGAAIPVVMTLTYADWRDQAQLTRYVVTPTSRVASSGVAQDFGVEAAAYFSLAPGHVFQLYGKSIKQDKLLLSDQITSNVLAALIVGRDNHLYDFKFDLAGNNRMVDIVPHQYVTVNIVAGDTPRGITYSAHTLIREIQLTKDDNSFLQTSWQGEDETFPKNSTNGDIPNSPSGNSTFPPVKLPALPPLPPFGSLPMPDAANVKTVAFIVAGKGVYYTKDMGDGADTKYFSMNAGIDPTLISYLYNLEISATGRLFLQAGNGNSNAVIYTAPEVGAPWTKVVNLADIYAMYVAKYGGSFDSVGLWGMGINRSVDDELMIVTNAQRNIRTENYANFSHGSSSSLTMGDGIFNLTHNHNFYGYWLQGVAQITYGSNIWTAYLAMDVPWTWAMDRTGNTTVNSAAVSSGFITQSVRGNRDGGHVLYWSQYLLGYSVDNFASLVTLSPPQLPFGYANLYQSIGADPTGQYLMMGQTLVTERSSDWGATWGAVPGLSGSYNAVWNLGDKDHWIIQGANFIKYTEDFGDTWVDQTGDLWSLVTSLFQVRCIRSF